MATSRFVPAATHPARRDVLRLAAAGGLAGMVALGACSSEGETDVADAPGPQHALLAAFPQSVPHVAAGVPTRLPYLVSDAEGVPLAAMTGPVRFKVSKDGATVAEEVVEPRSEGVARAYVPLQVTFPEVGIYEIEAVYEDSTMDGALQVYPADEVGPPVVGETLPAVASSTVENALDVDPICTQVPMCGFHEVDLADAVGAGKRIVLLVASPAYCRTAVCGPILENLTSVVEGRDDLVVIHSEVYKNPKAVDDLQEATLAPVPSAYELTFEPVLFVTDTAGIITARADTTIDLSEMREILA